ncbi:Na+/H+ antiporter NhaC family protein [Senegalia massiliensis]|uniref:Na+/H+ antiporter NhaC family protein n=1 Tax=Senegalia massiliensis TaxID=1720316 RepID=UPI001F5F9DE3|nr:Na+/H+ antiporter NhaC family protein [Senegalia massiliensis]
MKRKVLLLVLIFIFISTYALADEVDSAKLNAEKFGIWTLLPPLIAIVLAFISKNVIISLFIGVLTGAFILSLNNYNVFGALIHSFLDLIVYMVSSLADSWNAGIILQCLTIGGMIALISKMGGAKAIAESLAKKAKSPVSAQIITWILGLFIFFDDYANALIVGPIMRPVTDKMRISREKLAFIIDATAAPIAGIALISTWIGYEVGLIKDAYESIGQNVNAYGIFVSTIPYRFYNILILIFIVATAILMKEFGPMYKAEKRARIKGEVLRKDSSPMMSDNDKNLEPNENTKLKIKNALVPILVLMISAFAGFYYNGYVALAEDANMIEMIKDSPLSIMAIRETFGASDASIVLFQAALLASIVALLMGIKQKIFTVNEGIDTFIHGLKSLLITGVILVLAWSLSGVIKDLGTSKFLISILSDKMPEFLLPSVIFIFGAIISFSTGTSYGTMGILMPLTIPLAFSISPENSYMLMNAGAVLTGAIFGDHCSPISDTTILSSMGAACDHIDHVKTQLYYSITVGIITILFGYIPVGLGVPVYVVLPLGLIVVISFVYLFGKKVTF